MHGWKRRKESIGVYSMKEMLDAEILIDSPVIAAIKDEQGLAECLKTECQVIFILFGNVCNIGEIVKRIKDSGKIAIVHMDLITGLSSKRNFCGFYKKSNSGRWYHQYQTNDGEASKRVGASDNSEIFHH